MGKIISTQQESAPTDELVIVGAPPKPKLQPIQNDWRQSPTRWLGVSVRDRKPALTQKHFAALAEAARKNGGKPLTDEQRDKVLKEVC